jgi:hypothetical protein
VNELHEGGPEVDIVGELGPVIFRHSTMWAVVLYKLDAEQDSPDSRLARIYLKELFEFAEAVLVEHNVLICKVKVPFAIDKGKLGRIHHVSGVGVYWVRMNECSEVAYDHDPKFDREAAPVCHDEKRMLIVVKFRSQLATTSGFGMLV